MKPLIDLESMVHVALDNCLKNGYDPHRAGDWDMAEDLVAYDSGLNNFLPEEILPHVVSWKDR